MKPASPSRYKIVKRDALVRRVRAAQRKGERVVFTNGCFDLLHRGHVRSLEQAAGLGDRLIVAINSDASVRRLKGDDRPILKLAERSELVAALQCVDWVVSFSSATPLQLIERVRPDVLAKGGDWKRADIVGGDEVESWGGRVVRLREVPGVRTTDLIERARRRD